MDYFLHSMSLATNIKEFADVLHNVYAQQLSSLEGTDLTSDGLLPLAIPKIVVLQQACLYGAKSFSSGVLYLLTFQWLRDFSYFPLISPEIGDGSPIASGTHDTFLSEPASYLFSFAKSGVTEIGNLKENRSWNMFFTGFFKSDQLLAGFVNSFFFSLPFSLPHLISLRRMFSQGVAAATASIVGTVIAHSLLIIGVVYGIRFLIIPYYSSQPLTFCVQLITIAIVIREFVKEKRVYLVPLTHYPSLIRICIVNFVLALCESATVFHDLHHLTLSGQTSFLQLYRSESALDSFVAHTAYALTFLLGHTLFSFGFCYLILKASEKACSFTGWTLPQTARRINRILLVAILTLTFSGFPYYGLHYLFTKDAGFLPEDPVYRNTIFSPTQVRSRNRHFKSRAPATKNSKTPLELDLNYFDRGLYLNAPKEEKITSDVSSLDRFFGTKTKETNSLPEPVTTYDPALTFEELNYQGESAWLMRHERARRLPEEQDSKKDSIFQQPKTHFKQLRVNQDTKQAERALRESSQIGALSEWKEGTVLGETLQSFNQNVDHSFTALSSSSRNLPKTSDFVENKRLQPLEESTDAKSLALSTYPGTDKSLNLDSNSAKKSIRDNFSYGKTEDKRSLLKDDAFEKEVASNYEKSFASPFGEESDGTPPDLLAVENIIKKRYRLNPVYRALLQTDIDFFIARQPTAYKITQNQEANLFKKRKLLENYYNSIRYYSPVESVGFTKQYFNQLRGRHTHKGEASPLSDAFLGTERDRNELDVSKSNVEPILKDRSTEKRYRTELSVPFTKSFVETVYHQQFKGTLNTVKKFFKVTFDEQQNPSKNRILSYEQLLYKNRNLFVPSQKNRLENTHGQQKEPHPSLHEELDLETISPFLEESNSAPIYAGWDEKARRFVITNRFSFVE